MGFADRRRKEIDYPVLGMILMLVAMMGLYFTGRTTDTNSIKELSMIYLIPVGFFLLGQRFFITQKTSWLFLASVIAVGFMTYLHLLVYSEIIRSRSGSGPAVFRILFWIVVLGQIALFVYYAGKFKEPVKINLVSSPINLPVLIFTAICIASFIYTIFTRRMFFSHVTFIRQMMFVFTFFLLANLITKRWQLGTILHTMIIIAILCALYGFIQRFPRSFEMFGFSADPVKIRSGGFFIIRWADSVRIPSTFGNPNFFAAYIVLMVPLALSLMAVGRSIVGIALPGVTAVLLMVCLKLTATRGGWLGIGAGLLAYFLVFVLVVERKRLAKNLVFWIIIGILFITIVFFLVTDEKFMMRLTSTFKQLGSNTGTVGSRSRFYLGTIKMWLDKPIFGQGIGTFQIRFPFFRPNDYRAYHVSHNTRHAHCEYLQLLGEMGVIGLAGFLVVVVAVLRTAWKNIKTAPNFYYRHITLGLAASILGILMHNIVSVNLRWIEAGFFMWFEMGLLVAVCRLSKQDRLKQELSKTRKKENAEENQQSLFFHKTFPPQYKWPLIIGYCIAGLLISSTVIHVSNLREKSELNRKLGVENLEYKAAAAKNPQRKKKYVAEAKKYFEKSIRYQKANLSSLYKVAYIYGSIEGNSGKALETYLKITEYSPHYSEIHANLAGTYMKLAVQSRRDNPEKYNALMQKALKQAKEAVRIQNSARNHVLMMETYIHLDKPELVEKEYRIIRRRRKIPGDNPNNIVGPFRHIDYIRYIIGKGKPGEAEKELEMVLNEYPDHMRLVIEAAKIYQRLKKFDVAVQILEELEEKHPNNIDVSYGLGLAYYRNDQKYKARSKLRSILPIAAPGPQAENIKKFLQHINNQIE